MKVDRLSLHLGRRKEKAANQSKNEETEQEITKRKEEKVIRSVCSFQKRVGPPEYRKWRRIHGLQLPLHPQQIVGWIILLTIGAATFFVMIPALQSFFRNILFIILGTLFILHIVSHLTALLLDPADPELRAQKANFTVPEFDRTKHAHVIENGRCHLCNIKTSSSKTKHCSVCNKCIDHFDHHCKWLNHCIGGRNYVPFLICVISAVAASFVVVGVSVLEIVYYHVKPELLTLLPASQNGTTEMLFLPDSVFLSVIIVLGLLAATTAGLLLHLCLFHCYISFLGISTYEYIRNYRQEGGSEAERRFIGYNCCKKNNEVMTNRLDTRQKTPNSWTKFRNWCYYSCSRPPEEHDFEENHCCSRTNYFLFRTRFCFKQSKKHKRKILKRQSTDPEFVDKIIKPFLITLNEEKNIEATSSRTKPCYNTMNEHKQNNCTCRVKEEESLNQKQSDEQDKLHIRRFRHSLSWVKIILSRSSTEDSNATSKLKTNQICPTNAEEQPDNGTEIKKKQEDCPPLVHHTIDITSLPELTESNKSVQDRVDLKELSGVLDMVDGPESKFVLTMKSIYRKTRRKNFVGIPKSPPLSPIRESGLSNPGSPRVDLVLPPTPVFVRPNSPETSFIFLSNPSSLSSSSDDDNEIVTYPGPVINRHYRSEDILQTPQLPRKAYPNNKVDEIFVLPKSRNTKWINVELGNEV
ncbi:hypothetical protein RUM44_008835 [Polyplax serrata]|uniref:Palmitoyltransferase n=1 Tax=Polyplax serrata TaxID=468196 RepID=A0ABR1B9D7_POLSC